MHFSKLLFRSYNETEILEQVQEMDYMGGPTNTAEGLQILRTQVYNETNGNRPDIPDIAFVITDQQSSVNPSDTIQEVRK